MTWKDKLGATLNALPFTIFGKILILLTTIMIFISMFTPKLNLTTISQIAIVINTVLLIIIYCSLRDKAIYLRRFFGIYNKELQIWARVFLAQLSFSIALFILSSVFSIEITSKVLKSNDYLMYYVLFEFLAFLFNVLSAGFVFKQRAEENDYLGRFLLLFSINFFLQFFNTINSFLKIIIITSFILIIFLLLVTYLRFYFKEKLERSFVLSIFGFYITLIIYHMFDILGVSIEQKNNLFVFVILIILYSSMILGMDYRLKYLKSSQAQKPPEDTLQL